MTNSSVTKKEKSCYKNSEEARDNRNCPCFFNFIREEFTMTVQQRNQLIRSIALEISKQYKKEGFYLSPETYYEMAREVFEANENDFGF